MPGHSVHRGFARCELPILPRLHVVAPDSIALPRTTHQTNVINEKYQAPGHVSVELFCGYPDSGFANTKVSKENFVLRRQCQSVCWWQLLRDSDDLHHLALLCAHGLDCSWFEEIGNQVFDYIFLLTMVDIFPAIGALGGGMFSCIFTKESSVTAFYRVSRDAAGGCFYLYNLLRDGRRSRYSALHHSSSYRWTRSWSEAPSTNAYFMHVVPWRFISSVFNTCAIVWTQRFIDGYH